MLEQVLDLLKDGELHSLKEIADKMNVSLPLLEKMIEELVRLGYLKLSLLRVVRTAKTVA